MQKAIHAAALGAAMIASLALSGCPTQPSYPSTITPVYAADEAGGLWVYNGTSWTSRSLAGTPKTVVVSGSGGGAVAYVGGSAGVSRFDGAAFTSLGLVSVNKLFLGSNLYAATVGGVAILNSDGTTWTNNGSVTPVNDVCSLGAYTFVAGGTLATAGLYVYNGTGLVGAPGPTYTPADVVSGSLNVTAVFVDSLGDVIAGTEKGLAVQFAGTSSWVSQLPANTPVNQITLDARGYLYAATSTGLYIIGSSAFQILPTPTLCVCVDGAGAIYAGTSVGLQVSRNGGSTWTTELSGIQINSVTTTAPLYSF